MRETCRSAGISLAGLACFWIAGCGSRVDGPKRYQCSGTVTFQGQPIPKGSISFEPNAAAGNSGPGTMVTVEQGRFRTPPGKGIVGGAYKVYIVGFDGKSPDGLGDGNPLFSEVVLEREFPLENCQEHFALPVNPQSR